MSGTIDRRRIGSPGLSVGEEPDLNGAGTAHRAKRRSRLGSNRNEGGTDMRSNREDGPATALAGNPWPRRLSRIRGSAATSRARHAHVLQVSLLSLLALGIWLTSAATVGAQWYWQNPRPTAKALGDVSFVDASTGMAVGQWGAVLRTDDGGDTWATRAGAWRTLNGGVLAGVSLIDADTATVVGYSDGFSSFRGYIARTEDGGDTWTDQFTGEAGEVLLDVSFSSTDIGVAVGGGIFSSLDLPPLILSTTDGGETWTRQTEINGTSDAVFFAVAAIDSATRVVVGQSLEPFGGIILRTIDGGDTWESQLLDPTVGPFFDVVFSDPNTGFAVGDNGAILKTTDGGATWAPQASGTDRELWSVSCADANTCIVAGEDQILHTADGGSTWLPATVEGSGLLRFEAVALPSPTTAIAVGASQGGGEEPGPALISRIFKAEDAGGPWLSQTTGIGSVDGMALNAVSFESTTAGVAVGGQGESGGGGGSGSIIRTIDGGNTWMEPDLAPPSLDVVTLSDVLCMSPSTCVTVGENGTILRSTDSGETWMPQTSGTDLWLRGVFFSDSDRGTVVGGACGGWETPCEGIILGTVDGGNTWIDQTPEFVQILESVFFIDASTGTAVGRAAAGTGGTILRTTNGGDTWVAQTSGADVEDADLMAVFFTDASNGFVAGGSPFGAGPTLLRTTDGGTTWTDVTPSGLPEGTMLFDIDFVDADNGVIVGNTLLLGDYGGVVLRTTDGGETWVLEDGEADRAGDLLGVDLVEADVGTVVGGTNSFTPNGTGIILRTVGGPTFPLYTLPSHTVGCVPDSGIEEVPVDVRVGAVGGYAGTVQLSTSGEPNGVSSDVTPSSIDAPGGATWTLILDESAPPGRHMVTLTGDDGAEQQFANLVLDVVDPSTGPSLAEPGDGASEVDLRPTFTWASIVGVGAYRIQVATDVDFTDVVIDEETTDTSFVPGEPLSSDKVHFWRVQGVLECGGAWSEVFSFRTRVQPLAQVDPGALEFELLPDESDNATLTIANIGTDEDRKSVV